MKENEKRRHKRYDVENVQGGFDFTIEVNVVDFSMGGMGIETSAYLRVGSRHNFTLKHGDETLDLSGTVVRCVLKKVRHGKDAKAFPIYHAGIQFNDLIEDKARLLEQFIMKKAKGL